MITQAQSFTNRKTDFQDNTTLTFQSFDTLGGTRELESVSLRIEQTLRTQVVIPKPPKGAVVTVNVGSKEDPLLLRTSGPLGLSLSALDASMTALSTVLEPVTVSWSWNDGRAFQDSWDRTSTWLTTYTDPAALALFSDSDPFSLPVLGHAWSKYTSTTGSGSALVLTNADVRVTLDYRYGSVSVSAVPEPASLTLLVLGLVPFGWLALRARSRGLRRSSLSVVRCPLLWTIGGCQGSQYRGTLADLALPWAPHFDVSLAALI